jgi:hypothetical protein
MDWHTILTSVAGSSIVAAGICYILKRSFDRTLDLHFEKMKEEHKASIQEDVRRQAFIYDKQFTVLRVALSLVYRLRNTVRYVIDQAEKRQGLEGDISRQFQNDNAALIKLLYDERAILPDNIFEIAHDLKTPLGHATVLITSMRFRSKANDDFSSEELERSYQHVIEAYHKIDESYTLLVREVQGILGIYPSENDTRGGT